MLHPDLAQAKTAATGGRLEEAARLLSRPAVRDHRHAQPIIDHVVQALVARGRTHLQNQCVVAAREDASLAKQLGGRQVDVVRLLKKCGEADLMIGSDHGSPPLETLTIAGVGRVGLFRNSSLHLGAVNTPGHVDVRLQTRGPGDVIRIDRVGDEPDFRIDRHRYLSDGDRVPVGDRGRIRFHRRVAASGTVVLEVTAAGLPQRDIRHVVWVDDVVVIGPTGRPSGSAHFRSPVVDQTVLVQPSDGGLILRSKSKRSHRIELRPHQPDVFAGGQFTWSGTPRGGSYANV